MIYNTMNNEAKVLVHSSSFFKPFTQLYPKSLNFKLPPPLTGDILKNTNDYQARAQRIRVILKSEQKV